MGECLINGLVVGYGISTVALILYLRANFGKIERIWLIPFTMLVIALAFKVSAHDESTIPGKTDAPGYFTFVGETFFDAMVVLWSALLGTVFLLGTGKPAKVPLQNATDATLPQPDDTVTSDSASQCGSSKGEASRTGAEISKKAGPQQACSSYAGAGEKVTFSQLLEAFRSARPAASSTSTELKRLLLIPVALLVLVAVLALLSPELRGLGWVRVTALVMVLVSYLYGLWLLVLPIRTLLDPVPELMRELDRRYEQENGLRDFVHTVPEEQRRLLSARLERYIHRLTGASRVSQLAFVFSPLFAFLLELTSQGGLSILNHGPLLIGGALLLGALIGIMQLRRALVELESLQFSLEAMPYPQGTVPQPPGTVP